MCYTMFYTVTQCVTLLHNVSHCYSIALISPSEAWTKLTSLQIWNEIELFSAVLRWVIADPKRETLVPQIFHLLRFPLICYELLTHLVEPNVIFQRCPGIQVIIIQ